MAEKFYRFIHNAMGVLLAWGLLNILAGAVGSVFSRDKFRRQFWLQCLGWGLVNSLIGGISQGSYRKKLARLSELPVESSKEITEEPEPGQDAWKKNARNIFIILLVNVFLDVIYVLVGGFIRRDGSAQQKPGKAGIGFAFMVQGIFLFLFDGVLSFLIGRRWQKS